MFQTFTSWSSSLAAEKASSPVKKKGIEGFQYEEMKDGQLL